MKWHFKLINENTLQRSRATNLIGRILCRLLNQLDQSAATGEAKLSERCKKNAEIKIWRVVSTNTFLQALLYAIHCPEERHIDRSGSNSADQLIYSTFSVVVEKKSFQVRQVV